MILLSIFANIQPMNISQSSDKVFGYKNEKNNWINKLKLPNRKRHWDFYAKLERPNLQTVVCSATKVNKDKTWRDVRVFLQPRLLTEVFE